MSAIASQITSLTIVYSTVYPGADQSKHQSSASLAFVWGIHRGPVNSPHKWPVTRKMFPFDDVIMTPYGAASTLSSLKCIHLWSYAKDITEVCWAIEVPVIWDAMTFMWCHCNVFIFYDILTMHITLGPSGWRGLVVPLWASARAGACWSKYFGTHFWNRWPDFLRLKFGGIIVIIVQRHCHSSICHIWACPWAKSGKSRSLDFAERI